MTITEKILAKEAGLDSVKPGDNIWVNAGILLTHDVCGPGTIGIFKREFGADAKVFDKEEDCYSSRSLYLYKGSESPS